MKYHVNLKFLKHLLLGCVAVVWMLGSSQSTLAIFQHPEQTQVEHALKKGVDFAQQHRPPNELYWPFGSTEGSTEKFKPHGFLITKMSALAVMAAHYALRGEEPTGHDIQRVLAEDALQVVVTVFGDSPGFVHDSYLLLKQGKQVVKPNRIRFDARARAVGHDQGMPVYRAKIVGSFSYLSFEPDSRATLLVFPGIGGELRFDLDLSMIP